MSVLIKCQKRTVKIDNKMMGKRPSLSSGAGCGGNVSKETKMNFNGGEIRWAWAILFLVFFVNAFASIRFHLLTIFVPSLLSDLMEAIFIRNKWLYSCCSTPVCVCVCIGVCVLNNQILVTIPWKTVVCACMN